MRVFTSLNGREAVELVRERPFDLVLMDHMMPEMDGVEATRVIRTMPEPLAGRCRTMPIIALTANAVSGMREMFLENGFNDFLSKPIEIPRLDGLLRKWIPADKRRDAPPGHADGESFPEAAAPGNVIPAIAGVDAAAGIARIGGSHDNYVSLLEMFRRDAQAGFALLDIEPEIEPDAETLRSFITRVHGLKTALANIGAKALSQTAALLEKAGRDGDVAVIRDTLPQFRADLAALTARIGEVLAGMRPGDGQMGRTAQDNLAAEALARLPAALEAKDIDAIHAELSRLQALPLTGEQREAVGEIVDCILTPDFEKAAEAVQALLDRGR
jgi:CheY-like chemotaxis protein